MNFKNWGIKLSQFNGSALPLTASFGWTLVPLFTMVFSVATIWGRIEAVSGRTTNALSWQAFLRLIVLVCVAFIALPLQAAHAPFHTSTMHPVMQTDDGGAEQIVLETAKTGSAQYDSGDHVHETPIVIEAGFVHSPDWRGYWGDSYAGPQLSSAAFMIDQPPKLK